MGISAQDMMNINIAVNNNDITNIAANSINWSGDFRTAGRKFQFETVIAAGFDIKGGDKIAFIDNGYNTFNGIVISIAKNSGSETFKYTALDEGWRLTKSKASYNFEQKTAAEITKQVLSENGFRIGSIAPASAKMDKMFVNQTFYDIIMTAYTEESKASGKKYMIVVAQQMIHVIEKGVTVLQVGFEEAKNIMESEYTENAENILDRVVIADGNGNKLDVKDKKDLQEVYGVIQEVKRMQDESGMSTDEVNEYFKDVDKKCTLKGIVADSSVVTGNAVIVRDTVSGLDGKFYIDSDSHTYSNGLHEVDLTLNFKNIMDEKSADGDNSADNGLDSIFGGGGGAGGGSLVGKKVPALFTRYCPKLGGINGGNETASGQRIDYSKKTCAGPQSVKMFSNIQVGGTGTQYDGQVYVKNDHGGAINIVGGVYHFDLLMDSGKKCSDFGRRKGWAIIGPPGSPKFSSSGGVASGKAGAVVREVKRHLGKPYRWGATGPSTFDCSGLVQYCYKKIGINIPRTSSAQSGFGKKVGEPYQPGDLLFFGSPVHHVGMYIGNNSYIHAPQTGDVVKITKCGRAVTVARRVL